MRFKFLNAHLTALCIASILALAPLTQSCTVKRATVQVESNNQKLESKTVSKLESKTVDTSKSKLSTTITETTTVRCVELSQPDSSGKQHQTRITEQTSVRSIIHNQYSKNAKTENTKKETNHQQAISSSSSRTDKRDAAFGSDLFNTKILAAIAALLVVVILILKRYVK